MPSFTASGSSETVAFKKAGSYGIIASAGGVNSSLGNVNVVSLPKSFAVSQVGGKQREVFATSAQFTDGQFIDQFNNTLAESTTLAWTTSSLPTGASAPQFTTSAIRRLP